MKEISDWPAGRQIWILYEMRIAMSKVMSDKSVELKFKDKILPIEWHPLSGLSAVGKNSAGEKVIVMTIADVERAYPCTQSGIATAYRYAKASGNEDMIARTSAMFEIETFREDMELEEGDINFAQIGGYHKYVQKMEPKGYESHHIPSQTVQAEKGKMLPALAITKEDHKLTSSYGGKQGKTYHSVFPDNVPEIKYKYSVSQKLEQGGSGYIELVKAELLDLRITTGHRYDGGISAYLDAVIDMLATRGIPKVKKLPGT